MADAFDARVRDALRRRARQLPAAGGGLDDVLADVRRRSRRRQRMGRAAGALGVIAVLGVGAVAVGSLPSEPDVVLAPADDEPARGGDPAPAEPTPGDEDVARCEGEERGVAYRVHYPPDWWASDGSSAEACRWFHPEPFDMPEEPRDVPEIAILVRVQDRPFGEARGLGPDAELLAEEERTVDGRRALVQEYVIRSSTLYPEGTTFYRWLVDVDGRTLYGTTADADVVDADYDESRAVLEEMLRDLVVHRTSADAGEDAGGCSAAEPDALPEPQEGLPLQVAETRMALSEAALACDYGRLAELAGDAFTYSFGEDGDLAGYLRRQEAEGAEPLRYLTGLLERPHATIEVEGRTQYVWPSAFAYDDWAEVPAEAREALEPLYDEDDFAGFEQFGGYTGYRVGIADDGEWLFFVAGD